MSGGQVTRVFPFAAMMNPAAPTQVTHMTIAAFQATGFAVAGIHAFMMLRDRANPFHRYALCIALAVGGVAAVLQPISGDFLARQVARNQPVKLAAMEGQWNTEKGAPLRIGGLPNEAEERTDYAINIPSGLSWLAYRDSNAEVKGLKDFPKENWPPVAIVHLSFQIMVALGFLMMGVGLYSGWFAIRHRRLPDSKPFLWLLILCAPAGFIAIETGWTVTEVGRQPWIIYGIMRTADAVTPMPGIVVSFLTVCFVYLLLSLVVIVLLKRLVFNSPIAVDGTDKKT